MSFKESKRVQRRCRDDGCGTAGGTGVEVASAVRRAVAVPRVASLACPVTYCAVSGAVRTYAASVSGSSGFNSRTPCSAAGRSSALRQNSFCGSSVRPARATSTTTRYSPSHEAEQQSQRPVDAPQARDLGDSRQQRGKHARNQQHGGDHQQERHQPLRQRAARPVRRNVRHHHADELPGDEKRRDPADQPERLGQQAAPHAAQWRKGRSRPSPRSRSL